ncbi:MAG: hypothetical protein ABIL70_09740 [candidate division WOR-3 bacterium]
MARRQGLRAPCALAVANGQAKGNTHIEYLRKALFAQAHGK